MAGGSAAILSRCVVRSFLDALPASKLSSAGRRLVRRSSRPRNRLSKRMCLIGIKDKREKNCRARASVVLLPAREAQRRGPAVAETRGGGPTFEAFYGGKKHRIVKQAQRRLVAGAQVGSTGVPRARSPGSVVSELSPSQMEASAAAEGAREQPARERQGLESSGWTSPSPTRPRRAACPSATPSGACTRLLSSYRGHLRVTSEGRAALPLPERLHAPLGDAHQARGLRERAQGAALARRRALRGARVDRGGAHRLRAALRRR
jgi:hypothetical protein